MYWGYYNKGAKSRQLKQIDKVLILLLRNSNKLRKQWKGSFRVVKEVHDLDCTLQISDKTTFHLNVLKIYEDRVPT